jgi:serine/threonine protein kinase
MFKVLAFLKEQNVFHRDIKPENIFIVKDDEIRLADFGLAMRKGDVERSQMACGTIEYLSPELTKAYVTKSLESNPFDFPSDMWSTAYTVFLSASYRKPFVVDETPGWGKRLINEQKQFSGQLENRIGGIYKGNSKEESAAIALFETVLKRMFEVDPSRRLTPEVGLECIRGSEFP